MAFDSTANLLFSIGANSDDAEENIQRFRRLLGTDLDEMGAQFKDWAGEVVGDVSTVSGAMTAAAAGFAALAVAAAAFAVEAAHKFVEYAETVEELSLRTGIAAEEASKLIFVGNAMGVTYEALSSGLTKFSSYIVKSASDTGYAGSAFQRLGISQEA